MSHLKLSLLLFAIAGAPGFISGADHTRGSITTHETHADASTERFRSVMFELPPEETSLRDIGRFLTAVAEADSVVVLEGLPHQAFEHELREQELKRGDIVWFEGHPFYQTPLAVTANEQRKLTEIAQRRSAHVAVEGLKMCGGFHPDYLVLWKKGENTSGSLICFGCHEWKNFTPEGRLYEEIQQEAYGELRVILSAYAVNRPKPQRS